LFAGVVAGWWLRDLSYESAPFFREEPITSSDATATISVPAPHSAAIEATSTDPLIVPGSAVSPEPDSFAELLGLRDFERAITYYETAVALDSANQTLLKPALLAYLNARVHQCADDAFVDLIDLWLEAYYADIQVLLLLADSQRFCGSPEEAGRTLQIANTYALNPGERESVAVAVARLVVATDKRLSKRQDWIELLGFYEFLETIDLATNTAQLRRAGLYQRIGEIQYSRQLLTELQASDDGLSPEWTAALNRQLADSIDTPFSEDQPQLEIPLTRRGNHHMVSATINGVRQVALVIDTGASITTLSEESFRQMPNGGFRYVGTQLFNTANGMTQGEIYHVDSVQLGEITIPDLKIAVLELGKSDGLDGLLGMNVLRRFRFEIDQDNEVLRMSPRL
jgi:clan AA aspartic protease (TIGR02281 family)